MDNTNLRVNFYDNKEYLQLKQGHRGSTNDST